jgi:hypothetical protein
VLAAAHIAGVDEIWRIGGAQAIAALAYGTDRIARSMWSPAPAMPGSPRPSASFTAWSGIDMVAGPSEIVVVADGKNDPNGSPPTCSARPSMIRPASRSCSPTMPAFADAVARAIDRRSAALATAQVRPRGELGREWRDHRRAEPRGDAAGRSPRARASRTGRATIPSRCSTGCAMPDRSFSAAIRPRRSAIMWPGRTTCCPPGGARVSPRACRCSIS